MCMLHSDCVGTPRGSFGGVRGRRGRGGSGRATRRKDCMKSDGVWKRWGEDWYFEGTG